MMTNYSEHNESRTLSGFHCNCERVAPALHGNITSDVAVVGGSECGLLTAYLLKKAGIEAVLLEKDRCAGKLAAFPKTITAVHGVLYDRIAVLRSTDLARQYVNAGISAVDEYCQIIDSESIDCALKKISTFIYAGDEGSFTKLKNENRLLSRTNADTRIINAIKLPFETAGALEYRNQASFEPGIFFGEIAKGLEIYENTRVIKIDGHTLITDDANIKVKKIILCSDSLCRERALLGRRKFLRAAFELAHTSDESFYGGLGNLEHRGKMLFFEGTDKQLSLLRPFLRDSRMSLIEQGIADTTPDGVPYAGEMSRDVLIASGCDRDACASLTAAKILMNKVVGEHCGLEQLLSPHRLLPITGALGCFVSALSIKRLK